MLARSKSIPATTLHRKHICVLCCFRSDLVHDEHPRISEHGSGQAEELALPNAHVLTAFDDRLEQLPVHLADGILQVRLVERIPQLSVAVLIEWIEVGTNSAGVELNREGGDDRRRRRQIAG